MAETFTWCPAIEPQGTKTYRVTTAQFGDGYSQTAADGINSIVQAWPLSFKGKEVTIKPIVDFLDKHQGFKSFLWTPPLGAEGYYQAGAITLTPLGAGNYALDVTLQQVFKP